MIDTNSQEFGRLYAIQTFLGTMKSIAGLRDLIADTTESQAFRAQLQAALELSDNDFQALIDITVENFAGNYNIFRLPATYSTTILRFFTSSSLPGTIPLGTTARTPGLSSIEYATSIDVLSQPVLYDPNSGLYYIDDPATASIAGSSSKVPVNRVTQLSPPISGFSSVTNIVTSSGGTDRETNSAMLDRCVDSLKGRELDTIGGLEEFVKEQTGVQDAIVIDNSDPLMLRGHGSEVDIYTIVENQQTTTDVVVFNASIMSDSVILNSQPVSSVILVKVNGVPKTPSTDYNFVKDNGGFLGSIRGVDKVQFVAGHVPSDGDTILIEYTYNEAIGNIQSQLESDANNIPNSDILIKEAVEILIDITATITRFQNYSVSQVQANVNATLQTFFNALLLGDDIYSSDIVSAIEGTAGVDHLVLNKLALAGGTGVSDTIVITKNQYAALNSVTLH
jgi:uncharacterized phage protein gp47/JayE